MRTRLLFWIAAPAVLATVAIAGSAVAAPPDKATCTGTITADAAYDTLAVPDGATCEVAPGTTVHVNGKVDVGSNARLLIRGNVPANVFGSLSANGNMLLAGGSRLASGGFLDVGGFLHAERHAVVDLEGQRSTFDTVDIGAATAVVLLLAISADNNVSIHDSHVGAGVIALDDSTIGGQLRFVNNAAFSGSISRNTILKNFICMKNRGNITVFDNTVEGKSVQPNCQAAS